MPEKPPQNLNNPEEQKSPESELSPEVLEKVMAKVQDINKKGIAYSVLRRLDRFEQVFNYGLLGMDSRFDMEKETEIAKTWYKNMRVEKREERGHPVFFNIVGRSILDIAPEELESEIAHSYWVRKSIGKTNYPDFRDKVIIIFDISSFKEEPPRDKYNSYGKFKTYSAGEGGGKFVAGDVIDIEGKTMIESEYGFFLNSRVAQRYFRGILFQLAKRTERGGELNEEDKNSVMLEKRTSEILAIMRKAYHGKEKLLIPIYDIHGNLWWPKKMSYEEVKKFVEERDKNKEKK